MGESAKIKAQVAMRASKNRKPYVTPDVTVTKKRSAEEQAKFDRVRGRQDTERGHTPGLTRALKAVEETERNNKNEALYAFDANGNQVARIQGKGAKVGIGFTDSARLSAASQKRDIILTHNHPRGIKKSRFGNIGHSFSYEDLSSMLAYNAKEMRAATPTFTYSFKRPESGWGVSQAKLKSDYKSISRDVANELWNHERKRSQTQKTPAKVRRYGMTFDATKETLSDRGDVWYFNEVNKRLAEKYGWDYTRSQQHKTKGWSGSETTKRKSRKK